MLDINTKWHTLYWKETWMTPSFGNDILDTGVSGWTAANARTPGTYDITDLHGTSNLWSSGSSSSKPNQSYANYKRDTARSCVKNNVLTVLNQKYQSNLTVFISALRAAAPKVTLSQEHRAERGPFYNARHYAFLTNRQTHTLSHQKVRHKSH